MPDETKPVVCPKCAHRGLSAIIDLPTGDLYCVRCHARLPMSALPDPRRPIGADRPDVASLVSRIRSNRLRMILLALGDDRDMLSGHELYEIWQGESPLDLDDDAQEVIPTIERQIRRYNATLRRIGAGFQLSYSRRAGALVRVALDR